MIAQDRPALLHQIAQQTRARPLRQMVRDRLVRDIVRRLRLRARRERSISAAIDQNIAIADARMKLESALQAFAADRAA